MKKYESIFIIDEQKFDDGAGGFIKLLEPFIKELDGEINETNDMGQRQFAHPIDKKTTGHYLNVIMSVPKDKVVKVKEKFRLDPAVYRVEIFSYDSSNEVKQSVS